VYKRQTTFLTVQADIRELGKTSPFGRVVTVNFADPTDKTEPIVKDQVEWLVSTDALEMVLKRNGFSLQQKSNNSEILSLPPSEQAISNLYCRLVFKFTG
jgi:hypothetical protein